MTAFNAAQIPASIVSLEQLNAWSGTILSDLYPTLTAVEDTSQAYRVANSAPFFVTAATPATWRLITRTSLPLNSSWRRTGKIWTYTQDLGVLAIPADYTS